MTIKGVFFDLGGTLFRYTSNLRKGGGLKHLLSQLDIDVSSKEIINAWLKASKEVGLLFGKKNYFLHKDLFREMVISFGNSFGYTVQEPLIEQFHQNQLKGLLQHMPIRDDCISTLKELKRRGLYLSIVSNIDDDYLEPIIKKHTLDQLLDDWSSSEEAQSCKPDPHIFHFALKKSGLHKEEVLFVGDSLEHDVAGSHAVGIRSVHIVEEGVVTPLTHGLKIIAEPTYRITELGELIPLIESKIHENI
tara:strand:- start:97 stop:840 length:744 start_codon:yes stop_codon:yes gene_type:complete